MNNTARTIMKNILLSILWYSYIGCVSPTTNFIVYRDVPVNPSFVVVPFNYTEKEIIFANDIEHILISCQVSVHLRPATRFIENKQAERETEMGKDDTSTKTVSKSEWYLQFDEFTADYIVQSYQKTKQVKISKRNTQEILAVIQLPYYISESTKPKTPRTVIAEALYNLGIIHLQKKR